MSEYAFTSTEEVKIYHYQTGEAVTLLAGNYALVWSPKPKEGEKILVVVRNPYAAGHGLSEDDWARAGILTWKWLCLGGVVKPKPPKK